MAKQRASYLEPCHLVTAAAVFPRPALGQKPSAGGTESPPGRDASAPDAGVEPLDGAVLYPTGEHAHRRRGPRRHQLSVSVAPSLSLNSGGGGRSVE